MHSCLGVGEILELVARELVASGAKRTAVSLACCCRNFEDPVLDQLWETQDRIIPLLKCLPQEVWEVCVWREYRTFVSQLITLLFFALINPSQSRSEESQQKWNGLTFGNIPEE